MKNTANATNTNIWAFAPNTVTVNGHTFPASYSLARGGDVYVFTALRAAADAPEMPVRIHIGADMPMHADAVAAAQAAKDKPAPTQDKPAPAQEAAPAKPSRKPAQAKPSKPAPAQDKPAPAQEAAPAKPSRKPAQAKPSKPAPTQDKPAPAQEAAPAKPSRKPAQAKPSKPAPTQDKPAPADKPWIGTTITGKGWNIAFDAKAGRTRVLFQAAPTDAQKAAIESAGFYWSAQLKSWNKKLTCKAYRAAQALAATLNALA